MKRLFIAVPIREESRNQIMQGICRDVSVRKMPIRLTAVQNLHLTLQFLGNVEEKRIPVLKQILNRVGPPAAPEELVFTGIGAFPGPSVPRIIWIGIKPNEYLQKVQSLITQDLIRNGFEADRKKFKPHLTLARVKDGADLSPEDFAFLENLRSGTEIVNSPIDRVTLFESRLQPGGPTYIPIYEKSVG
ncbi:MAG: RNA 2',3'-cyclic phosphodiesterase [Flexilinea sp.]|nr:RNA 2',3'-cyclic phosphodiesterase [Flexilinea sp.]